MNKVLFPSVVLLAALSLAACSPQNTPPVTPAAPQGRVVYGLTSGGQLARFGADNAAASLTTTAITGLGSGETLADIDFNTNGGLLTGLTTNGKLYTINVSSGAATFTVTAAAPGVGTPQVIDFNPAAQRLRVLSDGDMNYRVTPATTAATAGAVTSDGMLMFAAADANTGKNPNLVAAAYTNSFKDFKPGSQRHHPVQRGRRPRCAGQAHQRGRSGSSRQLQRAQYGGAAGHRRQRQHRF